MRLRLGLGLLAFGGSSSLVVAKPAQSGTPVATPIRAGTPAATPNATPALPATPSASPIVAATPVTAIDSPEQRRATALLANEPGVYGYVVMEEDGTVVASIDSRTPFITASLYKLILMADIYQRVEAGSLDLAETLLLDWSVFDEEGDMYFSFEDVGGEFPLETYLFASGAYSSNAAARTLLTLVDTESLGNTIATIGLEGTYFYVSPPDLSPWPPVQGIDASPEDIALTQEFLEAEALEGSLVITTPLDMARYQLALLHKTLISTWVSEQITNVLLQQTIRDRIPFLLPTDLAVLNKTGNFDAVVNDVGIVYLPDGPRVIAILSQSVPDVDWATLVLQRLALIATGEDTIPPMPDAPGDVLDPDVAPNGDESEPVAPDDSGDEYYVDHPYSEEESPETYPQDGEEDPYVDPGEGDPYVDTDEGEEYQEPGSGE